MKIIDKTAPEAYEEIAKNIAISEYRKGFAPYALVVFPTPTTAHVHFYNAKNIWFHADVAARKRVWYVIVEM